MNLLRERFIQARVQTKPVCQLNRHFYTLRFAIWSLLFRSCFFRFMLIILETDAVKSNTSTTYKNETNLNKCWMEHQPNNRKTSHLLLCLFAIKSMIIRSGWGNIVIQPVQEYYLQKVLLFTATSVTSCSNTHQADYFFKFLS